MEFPQLMEQMSRRISDPKFMNDWLSGAWAQMPGGNGSAEGKPLKVPAKALVGPMEAWLHGAEALRHMQLDTIHRTQQRASQLARSLGAAHDQGETVAALQNFAQENFSDAMTYWATYQQIVRDTELSTIADATKAAEQVQSAAVKPVRKPARRRKAVRR